MSLLSSVILPHLEKELIALEPQLSNFVLGQIKLVSSEIIDWVDKKLSNSDLDKSKQ